MVRPLALSLCFSLTGCVSYSSTMPSNVAPATDRAILYGRFKIDSPTFRIGGYMTFGFRIACSDGKSYTIKMLNENPVAAISVSPGECSYLETVYSNADGTLRSVRPAPASALQRVRFEPGKAYYVGDYFGSYKAHNAQSGISVVWSLDSYRENYLATTAELKALMPQLNSIPTEIRMLIEPQK